LDSSPPRNPNGHGSEYVASTVSTQAGLAQFCDVPPARDTTAPAEEVVDSVELRLWPF